jgi:hypothetical protein
MHRRRFLQLAGRLGAFLGVATPQGVRRHATVLLQKTKLGTMSPLVRATSSTTRMD